MTTDTKRTIKISEEAYQALSHQSGKEKKPMEEIASAAILAALIATPSAAPSGSHGGEMYDEKGKRIFRRLP